MTRIILSGCCGKMGNTVVSEAKKLRNFEIIAGFDKNENQSYCFPVFSSFEDIKMKCDAVLDFSAPANIKSLLEFAVSSRIPAVIATTGYNHDELSLIENASRDIPVFFSYNMSVCVNLLCRLVKSAAQTLNGYDVDITEIHHRDKKDTPSGTALMIADCIKSDDTYNNSNIHSYRSGTVTGTHEVMFAGENEVLKISHSAQSPAVFASGALKACEFIKDKANGLYSMDDIIRTA